MLIKELCELSHSQAVKSGFWNCPFFDGGTCAHPDEFEGVTEISSDYCNNKCKHNQWGKRNNGELIALMHSELSEALEALRQKDRTKNNVGEELADCCIRIFDYCGAKNIDLENEIINKMEINKKRPNKHNKRF